MEEFEKVEQLVKVTGVSFEEAKNAIRACDGNIVDAMVYLEKLGKINKNNAGSRSTTSAEDICKKAFEDVKKPAGKFVDYMTKNKLSIKKGEDEVVKVPVGAAAILGCMAASVAVPAAFISMMCGYEYSLSGETGVEGTNKVMGKVGDVAVKVKEECEKIAQSVQNAVAETKTENAAPAASEEPKADTDAETQADADQDDNI
ncbi:MAG: hypothetical protein IJ065_05445 [Eubacterium sp.]|nr:hypothetical protein [Eubacterium sp.]